MNSRPLAAERWFETQVPRSWLPSPLIVLPLAAVRFVAHQGIQWAAALAYYTLIGFVPLFTAVGKSFIPHDDQSEFEVTVKTPEGYSLQRTDETLRGLEARLRELPHVTHLLTTIGDVATAVEALVNELKGGRP